MAVTDDDSSSSCPEDVSKWLQSIVDHLNVTQAKCLALCLRPVLESTEDSLKSVGADIQPFLESLANSAITELQLQTNDLTGNMQEFSKMLVRSRIEILNLYYNDLSDHDILNLAAILKETKIKELVISGPTRQLTNDQVNIFLAHLTNSHLRSLNISASDIFPFRKIYVFFRSLQHSRITSLNFSHVLPRYRNSSRKFANLFRTLTYNLEHTALTNLNLEGNQLNDSSAKALGRVLGSTKLEKLNLRSNLISDNGVDFLCAGLINSKVSHLSLGWNEIEGDNTLGESIKFTNIKKLDLSANSLTNERVFSKFFEDTSVSILDLSYSLRSNTKVSLLIPKLGFLELTCLNLSGNQLSFEHISALSGVLSQSKITHISLADNKLSEDCYTVLGECLERTVLKYVDLTSTVSSKGSIRGIASFVDKTRSSNVVSVNLTSNSLDLDVIAPSLVDTKFLELDISANVITTDIVRLADQLNLSAITSLSLGGCYLGDDAVAILASCLEESRVVLLDLPSNSVTSCGAKALAAILTRTRLRHLNLNSNCIEDDGLESLAESAKDSCITSIDVFGNPGERKLLVYRTTWENRTKVHQFADLLKRTDFFTGDSHVFEFDRDFDGINIDCFVEDLLKVYRTVCEKPYIVRAIEHDKCILDLNKQNCCGHLESRPSVLLYNEVKFLIEDCGQIYERIVAHPSPVQAKVGKDSASFFEKQALWLVLEYFPTKFVSFIGEKMEGDLREHVAFLRKMEKLGHSAIVELLLLNRPVYTIGKEEDILHPFVYKLLFKYKQTICNTDIEPEGVEKVIRYFRNHMDLEGASEVISLLNNSKVS